MSSTPMIRNPRFYDDRYTAVLPEKNPTQGTRLVVHPRDIAAYDQDLGINAAIFYTFNTGVDKSLYHQTKTVSIVTIKRTIPDDELLHPATLVVRATQYDNPDRYALATLSVNRPLTVPREIHFSFRSNYLRGRIGELLPINSAILTQFRLRFWLDDPVHPDMFIVNGAGDIILRQPLDYEMEVFIASLFTSQTEEVMTQRR
ncbi:hypothetical protein L9F63_027493 [Diploptera punctata]|uniref:Uncharacterized protein n=1 Tax=Diploptera punctata TaxID=6984 RepID=A0AAD8EL48_DIPPU|nr:hypothetical protein L9F63_027493 [Diploptera punctata]